MRLTSLIEERRVKLASYLNINIVFTVSTVWNRSFFSPENVFSRILWFAVLDGVDENFSRSINWSLKAALLVLTLSLVSQPVTVLTSGKHTLNT